jgi:hypothetical protein
MWRSSRILGAWSAGTSAFVGIRPSVRTAAGSGTRRHPRGTSRRSGVGLIEVLVALVLFTAIGGVLFLTTQSISSAFRTGMVVEEAETLATRTLDRVCETLQSSSMDMSSPQAVAPFSGDLLDFQQGLGQQNGAMVWGPEERFELQYDELDDGTDNDGDGLVDECRLVWVQNSGQPGETTVVLCREIREYLEGESADGTDENGNGLIDEPGFALDFSGGCVNVRLTVEMRDKKGFPIASTAQRSVAFRNKGN